MRRAAGGRLVVGLLLLLALVVRLVAAWKVDPQFFPRLDPTAYLKHARSIADGNGYPPSGFFGGGPSAYRPPAYPHFLAAIFQVGGIRTAQVAQAVLGTVSVALIGFIAGRVWDRAVALVSLAIAAIYPPLVILGLSLMSEALFVPLVLGALAAFAQYRYAGERRRWLIVMGVLVGLATLTRPNAGLMLVPLALGVWTIRPRLSRHSLAAPLVMVAAAVLTVGPWTVRNAFVMEEFIPVSTQTGLSVAGTYNPTAARQTHFPGAWRAPTIDPEYRRLYFGQGIGEYRLDREARKRSVRYLRDHPDYFVETTGWNALRLLDLTGPDWVKESAKRYGLPTDVAYFELAGFYPILLLALVGIFTRAARRVPWHIWSVPVVLIASTVWFQGEIRFRSPADPFIVMLASLAIAVLARRLRPGGVRPDGG